MGQKYIQLECVKASSRDWDAKWYAEREYAEFLHEDLKIRNFIASKLADASCVNN